MEQFQLSEITTKDNIIHQGIYFEPKGKSKTAFLWVHGLTSTFYSHVPLMQAFAHYCGMEEMGFASFNNRGHDMLAGIRKRDKRQKKGYTHVNGGAGYENFCDSKWDIAAGVLFLEKKGYTNIFLVGHSTGANKVCYFASTVHNPVIAGVVLAGPMSDRLVPGTNLQSVYDTSVQMKEKVKSGKGEELLFGKHFFPLTPKRYLSLFTSKSDEDTFDYGENTSSMNAFAAIRKPLLVILAGDDEAASKPIQHIKHVFDNQARSELYASVIIPQAPHSFANFESPFVKSIIEWTKGVIYAGTT